MPRKDKAAQAEYDKEYRKANPSYRRVFQNERHNAAKLALINVMGGVCVDCGFSDLSRLEVFQCDHLPQFEKLFNVCTGLADRNWDKTLVEAAKCELVCANCHATRTRNRLYATRES